MKTRRALLVCAAACVAVLFAFGATPTNNDEANGKAWWAHIQYLASDAMKGRQTGSPEYLKAAAYVVDQFKSYGLQPAGVNGGWYQPVHFVEQRVIAERSSLGLVVEGKPEALTLGEDADSQLAFAAAGEGGCAAGVHWIRPASPRMPATTISIRRRCRSPRCAARSWW